MTQRQRGEDQADGGARQHVDRDMLADRQVDQAMAAQCSQMAMASQRGALMPFRMCCSQTAENTAVATCNEGQALPERSMPLIMTSPGCAAQSTASCGMVVGHSQNRARQNRQSAPIHIP